MTETKEGQTKKSRKRDCTVIFKQGKNKGKRCNEVYDYCKSTRRHKKLMEESAKKLEDIKEPEPEQEDNIVSEPIDVNSVIGNPANQPMADVIVKADAEEDEKPMVPRLDDGLPEGIKRLDFRDIPKVIDFDMDTGFSIVILGSSKSGKSTLLRGLADMTRNADKNYIRLLFTPSLHNPIYDDFRRDKMTIKSDKFNDQIIKDINKINKKTKNKYDFMVIVDDNVDLHDNKMVKKLMCVLRNSNISTVLSMHSPVFMGRNARAQANFVFFKRLNTTEMVETVISKFLKDHLPGNMDNKIKLYKRLVDNFNMLMLDVIEGELYWIPAPPRY